MKFSGLVAAESDLPAGRQVALSVDVAAMAEDSAGLLDKTCILRYHQNMTLHYPIVVVREKGGCWAYVPDLPGVYGRGKTPSWAKRDLVEALRLYIEDCRADGDPLPRSTARIVEVDQIAIPA